VILVSRSPRLLWTVGRSIGCGSWCLVTNAAAAAAAARLVAEARRWNRITRRSSVWHRLHIAHHLLYSKPIRQRIKFNVAWFIFELLSMHRNRIVNQRRLSCADWIASINADHRRIYHGMWFVPFWWPLNDSCYPHSRHQQANVSYEHLWLTWSDCWKMTCLEITTHFISFICF